MSIDHMRANWLVGCVGLMMACGTPEMPQVRTPAATLTTDDLAVMRAVLDGFVRQTASLPAHASLVVFGSTMPACPTSAPTSIGLPDCIDSAWLDYLNPLVSTSSSTARAIWQRKNASSVAIIGDLGDDVVYAPADLDRGIRLLEFAREYAPTAIVEFSAPAYPSAGSAVIAYRYFGHGLGFVLLKGHGHQWKAVKTRGSNE